MEKIDEIIGKHSDAAFRGVVIDTLNEIIDWIDVQEHSEDQAEEGQYGRR